MSPSSSSQSNNSSVAAKGPCKLKQYLQAKKRLRLIGPPPTETTSLLQSYLDNENKDVGRKAKQAQSKASATLSKSVKRNGYHSNKTSLVIKKQKIENNHRKSDYDAKVGNDVWKNVHSLSPKKGNCNGNVFSGGTLDDLLSTATSTFNTDDDFELSKSAANDRVLIKPTAKPVSKNMKIVQENISLVSDKGTKKKKGKGIGHNHDSLSSAIKIPSKVNPSLLRREKRHTRPLSQSKVEETYHQPLSQNFISQNLPFINLPGIVDKTKKSSNLTSIIKRNRSSSRSLGKLLLQGNSSSSKYSKTFASSGGTNTSTCDNDRAEESIKLPLLKSSKNTFTSSLLKNNDNLDNHCHSENIDSSSIQSSTATDVHSIQVNHSEATTSFQVSSTSKSSFNSNNIHKLQNQESNVSSVISKNNLSNKIAKKRKTVNNDNFVKLNLRNSAGSCRGARNIKKKKKLDARRREYNDGKINKKEHNYEEEEEVTYSYESQTHTKKAHSINDAIDPIDDYLDGAFHSKSSLSQSCHKSKGQNNDDRSRRPRIIDSKYPVCFRHNRQCKLLVVKKNTTGNKGRKFFACSMPKGEQCNFFQWEDDTVEGTKSGLLEASSHSGFISRQVAAHINRLKSLTVPELKLIAKQRNLDTFGKKNALIVRLSVWVRDQICMDQKDVNKKIQMNIDTQSNGKYKDDIMFLSDDDGFSDDGDEAEDVASIVATHIKEEHKSDIMYLSGDEDDSSDDGDEEEDESNIALTPSEELELRRFDQSEDKPDGYVETKAYTFKSSLRQSLLDLFGYSTFRDGQEWAIERCLAHKKTLLVAPTGMGKSLCYALPAALMDGVCIVVSPLISLIEDQLRHLPPRIPSATLSGNISKRNMALIIDDLLNSRLKVLFVSPEKLTSAAFRRLLRPKYNIKTKAYERQLPPVSLLCLDEAHCLSQWGHNFRSSYLRIRAIINYLDPKSILALTATAGKPVITDICRTLRISDGDNDDSKISSCFSYDNSVKVLGCNRDNIDVRAVFLHSEEQKLPMLLKLIQAPSENFASSNEKDADLEGCLSKGSVIIYVWRKKDAEIIAEQLLGSGLTGGVVCYHGGMDNMSRSKAQSKFMRGKARICVATVAFGLGINKPDVKGVIHLCLPSSPENYLQEIGRAGRDGTDAKAIALVVESEVTQKHSLSFSNKISESQVLTFLRILHYLTSEAVNDVAVEDSNHESISCLNVAIALAPVIRAVDMKEETILTILSILEDDTAYFSKLLDIQGVIPDLATITLKKRSLENLATIEPVAQCILKCGKWIDTRSLNTSSGGTALQSGFAVYSFGTVEFSVTQCSRLLGSDAEPRNIYAALRRLQNAGELELSFNNNDGRSLFLKISREGLGYFNDRTSSTGRNWLHELTQMVCHYFEKQDSEMSSKVLNMQHILKKITSIDSKEAIDSDKRKKSQSLELFQQMIANYFETSGLDGHKKIEEDIRSLDDSDNSAKTILFGDIWNLLQHDTLISCNSGLPIMVKFGDEEYNDYTALLITKILHGIPSPSTPILDWYSHLLWGKWKSYAFLSVHSYVTEIISN